ncbi:TaqI-like C-terminal specificity domain-containing protein [Mesobacillus foraminis]|uniref:site-specific DNA-methyltransferase (adenine-specific) n=1 Tax=Mesobacillus foraminis TaxID=279826 RepID=A0A4V2RCJ1_9BACI|nr:TaqI-like C-terminal specificity domain-containing protein [Mesobacillus foraminis]TCN21080.1 N-6 DNA methylase [Mesobacillus foraminis]
MPNQLIDKVSELGAVYTPDSLALYVAKVLVRFLKEKYEQEAVKVFEGNLKETILNRKYYVINKLLKQRVLDPACGDGSLLSAFEKVIYEVVIDEIEKIEKVSLKSLNLTKDLYTLGVDIDSDAVSDANKKLNQINHFFVRNHKILNFDAILPLSGTKFSEGWDRILSDNSFFEINASIANPPWGANVKHSRDFLEKYGYTLAKGQFDIYELFIEMSISIVANNALMAFILPDSIFLPEHQRLRKFLLENTEIKMITRLGEGFFPNVYRACVVIILEKKKPSKDSITKCIRLNKSIRNEVLRENLDLSVAEAKLEHSVKQSRFYSDSEYRFDIDVRNEEENILKKIEKDKLNWELLSTGRGVELSKKGAVIECSTCKHYRPKPRKVVDEVQCENCGALINLGNENIEYIVSKVPNDSWVPLVAGEDVKRYNIKPTHYIKTGVPGINYKQKEKILSPKIIIRKTGVGINASYDNTGYLTTQTVFHFKINENNSNAFSHEYLLGVLNSRVMLYYYLKKYGDNEWKSHAYITQKIIKQLPVPKINLKSEHQVKQATAIHIAVSNLLKLDSYDIELDLEIERLVAGLYHLSEEECMIINETIKNAQQLKAISALTLPDGTVITPKKAY